MGTVSVVGRIAIIAIIMSLVWDTLIVEYFDVIISGSRLYPADIVLIAMLPVAIWSASISRAQASGASIAWLTALLLAFVIPMITGVLMGASAQGILRDTRNIAYAFSLLIFLAVFKTESAVDFIYRVIRTMAVVAAVLILVGYVFDWRIQEVDEAWLTIETQSAVAERRGFGVISSYVFISLALYLDTTTLLDSAGKRGYAVYVRAAVLAVALGLTYVRAYILFFALSTIIATVISTGLQNLGRGTSLRIELNARTLSIIAISIGGFLLLALLSDTALSVGERAASILFPGLGGESGEGTAEFRIRAFEFANESVLRAGRAIFGYGFGSLDVNNPIQVELLNHNSYAWLLSVGGYLSLIIAVAGLVLTAIARILDASFVTRETIDAVSITAGYMAAGLTTNHMFSSYQPSGLIVIALFISMADVSYRRLVNTDP